MDEENLNMQIRKFLKKVGINSQREIESAIRTAIDSGQISVGDTLTASMQLSIGSIDLKVTIDDSIRVD